MSLFKSNEQPEEQIISSNNPNSNVSRFTSKFNKRFLAIFLAAWITVWWVWCAKEQTEANTTLPDSTSPAVTETVKENTWATTTSSVTITPDSQDPNVVNVVIDYPNNENDKKISVRKDTTDLVNDLFPANATIEQKKAVLQKYVWWAKGWYEWKISETDLLKYWTEFFGEKFADMINSINWYTNKDLKALEAMRDEVVQFINACLLLENQEIQWERSIIDQKTAIDTAYQLVKALEWAIKYTKWTPTNVAVDWVDVTAEANEEIIVIDDDFIISQLHLIEIEEKVAEDSYVIQSWNSLDEQQQELMKWFLQIEYNKNPNAPFWDTFLACKAKVLNAEKIETEAKIKDLEDRIAKGEKLENELEKAQQKLAALNMLWN